MIDTPAEPDKDADAQDLPTISRASARRRLPRVQIDWRLLFVVIALVGAALFALLLPQGTLPAPVRLWWPLAIIVFAALWFLRALTSRAAAGLLGSTTLIGLSVSLLLASAYQVPLSTTWIGVALIAMGMGIVIRGLLWRPPITRRSVRPPTGTLT